MPNDPTLVQLGLDALTPAEELQAKTPDIQAEVEAKSATRPELNIFDDQGNFSESGQRADGDNPIGGRRLAFNQDVESEKGKSIDTWEQYHGPEWLARPSTQKKLAKQRSALARAMGVDESEVTNEHVFRMGDQAAAQLDQFFATKDGLNRVSTEGETFDSQLDGDNRQLGQAFLNERGEDARDFMNTPLWNANYFSDFNQVGRAQNELGTTRREGDEELSDFEATQTTEGRIDNAGLTLRDAGNNTASGIGDLFANTIGKIAGQLSAGEADITPEDEATFRRIREGMVQATEEAKLEFAKEDAQNKNAQIEVAKNEAIANLYGDPVEDTGVALENAGAIAPEDREAAIESRADQILRSRLSPEEIAFMDGTGTATRTIKSTSTSKLFDSAELRGDIGKVVETPNDKFETLDTQRKVRAGINAIGQTTLGDIASGRAFKDDFEPKVNKVTGAPEDFKTANTALADKADKDAEILGLKKDADKILADINEDTPTLVKAGKYVTVAAKWVQGGGKRLVKHPEASFLGVLQSAPEMAAMVTVPALAITGKTHKNYEDGKNKFFEERDRFPNEQEQSVLLATSTASALIEKVGADFALKNKVGKLANDRLTKLISSNLGVSASVATSMAAAAVVEGGEEALVSVFEQVGVNQGKDKLVDSDKVYDSFIKGVATGGAMRSILEAPNVPAGLKSDIQKAAGLVSSVTPVKGVLGKGADITKKTFGIGKADTPEKRREVADKVVADVARSSGTNVDEVLTPNIVVPESTTHDFSAQLTGDKPQAVEVDSDGPTTAEAVDKAFDDLGKFNAGSLESQEGIAEVMSATQTAQRALQNDIQNMMQDPESVTEAQIESINSRQQQIDFINSLAAEKSQAAEVDSPAPVKAKGTGDIGVALTRGSAAAAEIDTTGLSRDLTAMVSDLAQFDNQLQAVSESAPKSFQQVQGEALGTRTNSKGKAGVGQHLANLGAAVASNNLENAANAVQSIVNFRDLQRAKHSAISKGFAKYKSTGKEVKVTYGKGSEFVVNSGATEGILNHIQSEIDVIDSAAKLAGNLGEAHFYPEAYAKRKIKEDAVKIEAAKAENAKAVDIPPTIITPSDFTPPTQAERAGNEASEAGEVVGAESAPQRSRQDIARQGRDVQRQLATIDAEIAAAPTTEAQNDLIQEKQNLETQRNELREEFNAAPRGSQPLVPSTATVTPTPAQTIEEQATEAPKIDNSPEVTPKQPVDKPSKLQEQQQNLFSKAAIENALSNVRTELPVGVKDAPVRSSLIEWSKNVKQRASKALSGPGADTSSTRMLRPLREMISARHPEGEAPGIIGNSNNLFGDIKAMSDDRFSNAEWDAIQQIEQFSSEMSQALDAVMPEVKLKGKGIQPALNGDGFVVFRQLANRSPVFQLMDERGQLAPEVKDAISVAVLDWVQAHGTSTMYQTPADIYRFFGLDEKQNTLSDTTLNVMGVLGTSLTPQALSVGKAVLTNLNIRQANNPNLDGLWETRMAQSIGDLAFVAMSNMTTTPTDGSPSESRGYIEFNSIPVNVLSELSGQEVQGDVDGNKAMAKFVRLPLQTGSNGFPLINPITNRYVLGKSLQELTDLTASTPFKTAMKAIVGSHRREGGVTAVPQRNVPEYHTGTSTKLTPLMRDYVRELNSQTMIRNPQWDLMRAFDDNPKEWLRMHGWVEPTVEADGTTSFPDLHDAHAVSANGKNMGLEREYAQMLQHEVDYDAGLAEVNSEIEAVENELIARGINGENIDKLNEHLTRLEREREAYQLGEIHLEHHVISTGRVNDRSSTLSIQRSKMHRNALSFKKHVEQIDITNPEHRKAVVAGLIEPLDLNEIAFAKEGTKQFDEQFMDAQGNASDPVIRKGIEAIQAQMRGEDFKHSDISDAVVQIGEGAHTLNGLMVVANWSQAVKNGDSQFTSYGYTEVDGTTNGVIASMRQLVGGYDSSDTDPAPGSKTRRIRDLFNAGGQIFKDQTYREGIDYLESNPDAYQNIGILASERLEPIGRQVRDRDLATLKREVDAAVETRNQTRNSTFEIQQEAQDNLDRAQANYGVKVFEATIPDFGLVDGKVTKPIRTMMKAIVMPGGYQAGDTALANSLFNAWLSDQYTAMGNGDIAGINDTLSKAGLPTVTTATAKNVLPPSTVKSLRYIYTNSLGKNITQAYRESMGDFNENAKTINAAYGLMGIIVADVTKKSLSRLEAAKGSALTNEEIMNERKRLQEEEGLFVGYRQSGATGFSDSISIIKEEKARISKDRGGNVESSYSDGAIRSNVYNVNTSGILEPQRGVKTTSRTSRLKEFVPSADVGVSGMITTIIGIDSITQARSLVEGKDVRGNVFDANITSMLNAAPEAVTTNRVWDDIHRSWSAWDAVGNQLEHLMTKYPEAAPTEINEFFKAYDKDAQGVETGNKFAPVITNSNGSTSNFAGVSDFIRYFKEQQAEGNRQREAINNDIAGTAQHRIVGGTAWRRGEEDAQERGSASERIDIASFDEANRAKATPERVSELFYGYVENGGISDSAAHKQRLMDIMDNHILPLVRKSAGYTVTTDNNAGENAGITGGAVRGQDIYIRSSDTAIRRFSTDMSDAEVLTHEFLHPIVEAGLLDNTQSIKTLRDLQRQAIESPTFTPDSLVNPNDTDQVEAKRRAQALYDYITGDIHEFMVFGLSNDVVRTALSNERISEQAPEGIVSRMLDVLSTLIERLTGKVIGRTQSDNVTSELDALIAGFDTTTRVHLARKVGSIVNNKYVSAGRGFVAERVAKPLADWGRTVSYKVPPSKIAATGQQPSTRETLTALAKSPIRVFDTGFQKAAAASARVLTDHKQDFFSKLARETLGPTVDSRPYHLMLARVNEHVDSASLRIASEIKSAVTNSFSRALKDSEQKLIADTVLRGDLKVFKDMNLDDVAELISDTEVLDSRIRNTVLALQSTDKKWINDQAKSLGSVMAQGKALIADGNLNAFNIATGVSHPNGGRGLVESDTQAIDELKSMYAIKFMGVEARNQITEMIRQEPQGISLVMEVDAVNHKDTLEHTYNGDRSRVVAGEVISKSRNRSSAVILPTRDHAQHVEAGYTRVKDMGSRLALYTRPDVPAEGYQKGIFSMGNAEMEGTTVKREDRAGGEVLLPIVVGGRVIGYRAILDKETREAEAGMTIGATESLGNHGARTHRLASGGSFNTRIVDMARQDFLANGQDTRAFIRVSVNSSNPQVAEFARLIPREMRNRIQEQWGGDMYLRKNQLDLLLGYRKLSLVDEINRRRVTAGESEMNAAVSNSLRLAGDVWQGVVSEVKRRTVLFTPAVVLANITSNLAVSVLHGMNPVNVVRDQFEGLRAIRAYTTWQSELAAVDLQIKLGEDIAENQRERKRIVNLMESSGVHDMVQAGMFQSIVEDIDITAGESSPLNSVVTQALPQSITESASDLYRSAPDSVKKGLGVLMLSPLTEFGANVQAATAFSDFMARYAMVKHLRSQRVSQEKAMNEAMDIFVDYTPNTSREMQYINDSGMYMYTKFLFRIQRVIMRAFRKHPEAVVGMEATQQMMGDFSDITDSSLLWGLSLSGGRTQTPDEAFETVTEIPLLYMFNGLKDVM